MQRHLKDASFTHEFLLSIYRELLNGPEKKNAKAEEECKTDVGGVSVPNLFSLSNSVINDSPENESEGHSSCMCFAFLCGLLCVEVVHKL